MFEAVLLPDARAARDTLSGQDREDVTSIIRLLELNPWSDGVTKFTARMPQGLAGVYDDGRWEVIYRVIDDRFIEVVGISRVGG